MKIKTLASGSKGNSTLLQSTTTNIIIDLGINYLPLKRMLEEIDLEPQMIDGVLITHIHNDHIKGLASFIKKTNTKVYVPKGIALDICDIIPIENIVTIEDEFSIGDINIELIHTSHDTPCSVGYVIQVDNKSLVYVTDTGYINKKYLKKMINKDIYILESNHDEQMLMDGPYPYYLKQRVIGDKGHLSNSMASKYLAKIIGDNTKYIILAHLSEKNNTEEIALETLKKELIDTKIKDENILIAKQNEEGPYVEV